MVYGLMPMYTGLGSSQVQDGFALKFYRSLWKNDIDGAMQEMKAFLAGIPYVEGFQKKLDAMTVMDYIVSSPAVSTSASTSSGSVSGVLSK